MNTFKEFSETIYGFGLTQFCSFVVTGLGVYAAVWWNDKDKKKKVEAKHKRFLHSIYFQTKFRQQKIFEALTEPFQTNKLVKMHDANLKALSHFLPAQETISEALADLEAVQYFSGLRDQFEWSNRERLNKGTFVDLYLMGLMLQKFELALIGFLGYESTRKIWGETAELYCQLPYLWLARFGVNIGEQFKLTPSLVADRKVDVITPAAIVALEISNLVDGKELIEWKTTEKENERLFVALYEVGVRIEGYDRPELHELMKGILAENRSNGVEEP
jgi:hypothetical protein